MIESSETIEKAAIVDHLWDRLERYVNEYDEYVNAELDDLAQDRKYSAYEVSRLIRSIDMTEGKAAVSYLREHDL